MILMDVTELKKIGPGQYKSVGTGGLKNEEIRALHYRLSIEQDLLNTSADATRLLAMLERKVLLRFEPTCLRASTVEFSTLAPHLLSYRSILCPCKSKRLSGMPLLQTRRNRRDVARRRRHHQGGRLRQTLVRTRASST